MENQEFLQQNKMIDIYFPEFSTFSGKLKCLKYFNFSESANSSFKGFRSF